MVSRLAGVLVGALLAAGNHPMHTSVTELLQESDGRMVQVEVRIFQDDLAAAIGLSADDGRSDALIREYVPAHLILRDRGGAPLPLQAGAIDRVGDVVRVSLRVIVPGGLAEARISNGLLSDRFQDQVNIVRATYDGRTTTLIFTPGDPAKPFP